MRSPYLAIASFTAPRRKPRGAIRCTPGATAGSTTKRECKGESHPVARFAVPLRRFCGRGGGDRVEVHADALSHDQRNIGVQIGRASCRERVESSVVAVSLKKKET